MNDERRKQIEGNAERYWDEADRRGQLYEEIGQLLEGSKSFQIQQFKPVNTLDKTFEKINPFAREKLQALADRVGPYFEKVNLEGI